MKTKNIVSSFLAILTVLFLVSTVSATEIADITSMKINGITVTSCNNCNNNPISVIAGEIISADVYFIAEQNASNVRMKVMLEGIKEDVSAKTNFFDIEAGHRYSKSVSLRVPYELKDEVSRDITLEMKIWNSDYEAEIDEIVLRVQRPSYNLDIMSISTHQNIEAGETIPVDIVIKNIGYNDLDDLYITAKIPGLGVEKKAYFGDLVSAECCENDPDCCNSNDEDSVRGRLYLEIPYDAKEGIYTLEVEADNSDLSISKTEQIYIRNDFSEGNVIVSSSIRNVAVGENAEFDLVIVNPTNKLKVYRIVTTSSGFLDTEASQTVIAVPAGSSERVKITAVAEKEGEYSFNMHIFSGEELVNTKELKVNVSGNGITNPVVILTIVLAIIFLVLLVILIMLLGKKPKKSEEFGESYY